MSIKEKTKTEAKKPPEEIKEKPPLAEPPKFSWLNRWLYPSRQKVLSDLWKWFNKNQEAIPHEKELKEIARVSDWHHFTIDEAIEIYSFKEKVNEQPHFENRKIGFEDIVRTISLNRQMIGDGKPGNVEWDKAVLDGRMKWRVKEAERRNAPQWEMEQLDRIYEICRGVFDLKGAEDIIRKIKDRRIYG